jgi:hypothetical protein
MSLPDLPSIDSIKVVSIAGLESSIKEIQSTLSIYMSTVDSMKSDLLTLHKSLTLTIHTLNGICSRPQGK